MNQKKMVYLIFLFSIFTSISFSQSRMMKEIDNIKSVLLNFAEAYGNKNWDKAVSYCSEKGVYVILNKEKDNSKRQNIDTKYMNYYTNRAKLKEAFLKNHINLDITITVSIYWDYKKSHEYTDTFKSSQILSERFRNTLDKDGKVKNITFLSKAYAYYADRQFFIMLLNESNGWKIRLIFNAPHSIRYATTTEWFDTQYFPDELSELIGNRDIR